MSTSILATDFLLYPLDSQHVSYYIYSTACVEPSCWSKMASSSCRIEIRYVTSCPVFDVSLIYILITFFPIDSNSYSFIQQIFPK